MMKKGSGVCWPTDTIANPLHLEHFLGNYGRKQGKDQTQFSFKRALSSNSRALGRDHVMTNNKHAARYKLCRPNTHE